MIVLNQVLLILHFVGLTLGFTVSIANMVMLGLINTAAPAEKPVLGRFPPAVSRVGRIGLSILWVTGAIMVYTRWNGFASLPWQFHVKLTAVIILTIAVVIIYRLEQRIARGDAAAMGTLQNVAKVASLSALTALIFAVLAFD